jgi:hypothetical protein
MRLDRNMQAWRQPLSSADLAYRDARLLVISICGLMILAVALGALLPLLVRP